MGLERVGHDWVTNTHTHTHTPGEDDFSLSFTVGWEQNAIGIFMDDNNNDNNNLQWESLLFRGTFKLLYQDPDFDNPLCYIIHQGYAFYSTHSHILPFPSISCPWCGPGHCPLILNECKVLSKFTLIWVTLSSNSFSVLESLIFQKWGWLKHSYTEHSLIGSHCSNS